MRLSKKYGGIQFFAGSPDPLVVIIVNGKIRHVNVGMGLAFDVNEVANTYTINTSNQVVWDDGKFLAYDNVIVLGTDPVIGGASYTTVGSGSTMSNTLTFTGHSNSYCKVNNQTVTFPYTLQNGDVITFGNDSDVDRYFTVNGSTTIPTTINNESISIVGISEGSGPIMTLEYSITYTEVSQKSVDLTSLSGYESLAAGTYALAVKAKAANYQDSDLSSTVSFTKLAAPVATAS